MFDIAGIDVGRYEVKGISPHGHVRFPSVACPAWTRDVTNEREEYLVTVNGREYFVGQLALDEGGTRAFQRTKLNHENHRILFATAIALLCDSPTVKVVTGIPLADFSAQKEATKTKLLGTYEVRINGNRKCFTVTDVIPCPEAGGAIWGELLRGNERLKSGKIGVIDIGFMTTDLVTLNNLKYIDRESTTIYEGINTAQQKLRRRLLRETDEPISMEDIDAVEDAPEYEQLAQLIKDRVNRVWQSRRNIFLTGGGAYRIRRYLPYPMLPKPEWSNAVGFFEIGKVKFNGQK